MREQRAADPVQVVRDILADGPLAPPDFRRLANERGVSFRALPKAARLAGAECRRYGPVGKGGYVWEMKQGVDRFITTYPNRNGFYADNIFLGGKEVQCKLANDLDTARVRVAELLKQRDAERERSREVKRQTTLPPSEQSTAKAIQPVHAQLRDLARQIYRLARTLETKGPTP